MINIFKLIGSIFIDDEDAHRKLDNTIKKASSVGEKFGKMASAVGKATAAAVGAASTAIGAIAKEAIDSYAEYEQLVGGSQLLFGDAYEYVAEQAKNAYKDVQMSQNDYLKQVNGFATGLKTSLGGNEQAAAELAAKIIKAEADVVAATGNSQEAVQNAFNGIMKSNFTMLDNLQLGITPTKEGFQEVIDKVNKWNKANGKATKYQIKNLADCQSALVDYIEMQGLAGYAANEAAGTIQGSLAMTKAAWQNLLTGFADDSADSEMLINNFVDSAALAVRNIVPKLAQILSGISTAMAEILPVVAAELPTLLEELLPGVITGAVALVNGLIMALPSILQILIEQLPSIISQIAEALIACFPVLLDTVTSLLGQIFDFISLELLNTGTSFEDMTTIIKNFWESDLKPCFTAIGDLIQYVLAPIFDAVFTVGITSAVSAGFNVIKGLWQNVLMPIFIGITDFLVGVFTANWDQALNGILGITIGIWDAIVAAIQAPMELAKEIVNNAIEFIKEKFDFKWEFPKLKLPHFNISGSFSLNPPSVPRFSIEWYKKAYDEAMILSNPTIFGYSAATGKFLGGGEGNGNEVVAGEAHLINMIQRAVNAENAGVADKLDKLISMLANYFPEIIVGMNRQIVLDSGAVVAELAPRMDTRLGIISTHKGRGN